MILCGTPWWSKLCLRLCEATNEQNHVDRSINDPKFYEFYEIH